MAGSASSESIVRPKLPKSEYKSYAWKFLDGWREGTAPEGRAMFKGEWPTLPEMYKITVRRFPDRPCFTIYDPERISLSYTEALVKIQAVARALYKEGIRKGDRVALTGKNLPEWTVAYLGVLFAGAVVVPIDYQLRNDEQERIIKKAGARMLFVDEEKHD
jgi:long-chain acyl-CoA synthetase